MPCASVVLPCVRGDFACGAGNGPDFGCLAQRPSRGRANSLTLMTIRATREDGRRRVPLSAATHRRAGEHAGTWGLAMVRFGLRLTAPNGGTFTPGTRGWPVITRSLGSTGHRMIHCCCPCPCRRCRRCSRLADRSHRVRIFPTFGKGNVFAPAEPPRRVAWFEPGGPVSSGATSVYSGVLRHPLQRNHPSCLSPRAVMYFRWFRCSFF
jgi:hypothetical protein